MKNNFIGIGTSGRRKFYSSVTWCFLGGLLGGSTPLSNTVRSAVDPFAGCAFSWRRFDEISFGSLQEKFGEISFGSKFRGKLTRGP
jgi:hypothetical protein